MGKNEVNEQFLGGCLDFRCRRKYFYFNTSCAQNSTWLQFRAPRPIVYRTIYEHLETVDRVADAIDCFQHMMGELAGETHTQGRQAKWALGQGSSIRRSRRFFDLSRIDFKQRCAKKLVRLGDAAVNARRHEDAITQYSISLLLDPPAQQEILTKRSKVYVTIGLWENALKDATKVHHYISCNPHF